VSPGTTLPQHDKGEQTTFYRDHGWVVVDDLFSSADIDAMADAAERYWSGERDRHLDLEHLAPHLDGRGSDNGRLRLNDYPVQQLDALARVALKPALGEVAASLAGTTGIRLLNSELIYKPPGPAAVGWHVDKAYWQTCTSTRLLTAWIPLHDCPREMGTLRVLDESHRWPASEPIDRLRRGKTFLTDDPSGVTDALRNAAGTFNERALELRKGQVSFHHCLLFHGSEPNQSDLPRRVLVLHLQDEDNRYRRALDASGTPLTYKHDAIARRDASGAPDYADPTLCPQIWPEIAPWNHHGGP
jgi:ectoine hydroxylase-related dioxygenase (phytanoyl-CoA dioxygenase family)